MNAAIYLLALAASAPGISNEISADCDHHAADQIVVCGPRASISPYRLPKPSETYEPKRIRAESELIRGVHAGIKIDPFALPGGLQSNRLMLTINVKF